MALPYDKTSPISIENYAIKLIGHTFEEVIDNNVHDKIFAKELKKYYNNPRSKGGLGLLIEKYFFFYEPNSDANPDFPEAGVELKVTPYEQLSNKKYRAGERLVLGMIPNNQPIETDFYKSDMLNKMELILLILYLRDRDIDRIKYRINYVKLLHLLGEECREDLEIIKADYNIIVNKIQAGKAHELSEADTMYLGACTKGSTAKKSLQPQYYNPNIKAKRRAFSLKQGYMTAVINKYIFPDVNTYEEILPSQTVDKETFESIILSKIYQYQGLSESELRKRFNLEDNTSKDIFSLLVFAMLGIKSNQAEEFVKSNTVIRALRVESNNKIKESLSVPTLNFIKFSQEDWEESEVYRYFSETRFLFTVYKKEGNDYILRDAFFWNMPMKDLEGIGREEWLSNQNIIRDGVSLKPKGTRVINNLPKSSNTQIFHLRPHATKSAYLINGRKYGNGDLERDTDLLPNGDRMVKQSFWLNNRYVESIVHQYSDVINFKS
ncbi:DNA mismatch repair protein MutH [Vagococcus lutrae]|uniref:Sau3AI family type II restriction endonuclease n=1 Tax=Vagococcus lutrae TaxID=81947 RepID=UPI001926D892|nr:Sau3AI family type II restriction endonuclease [Vagococcus lutrae]GEQ61441.1 DNA mismatch repair protein MutH [Vagococcus lutrae]GEQ63353.1 DNA mismatch repair protein MutH [Vagococcus lutrae]GEQ65312.1 DNA mismatch repair protein MutH [Vagococcus lutrae]